MKLVIGIIVLVIFLVILIYNSLVHKRNNVKNSKSAIDVYLQQRFDLIPNLVEVTKEYANIMAIAESNPDLKASEQFLNLQKNLSKIESQLQAARRIYNMDVTKYNTATSTFPTNIFAKLFGFKKDELFKLEGEDKVEVKF